MHPFAGHCACPPAGRQHTGGTVPWLHWRWMGLLRVLTRGNFTYTWPTSTDWQQTSSKSMRKLADQLFFVKSLLFTTCVGRLENKSHDMFKFSPWQPLQAGPFHSSWVKPTVLKVETLQSRHRLRVLETNNDHMSSLYMSSPHDKLRLGDSDLDASPWNVTTLSTWGYIIFVPRHWPQDTGVGVLPGHHPV